MKHNAKVVIINSFKELLNKKSIDKITVKEICGHSNVNRQTFYNHFTDIVDIFKHIFYKELSEEISQNRTLENWCGGFLATMNYLKKNSKMIIHVYNSSYWPEANRYIVNLSKKLLEDVVDECCIKRQVNINENDKLFIINFYIHVFNGLIFQWIDTGLLENPEVILKKLLVMIEGSIPRCVENFIKQEKAKQ